MSVLEDTLARQIDHAGLPTPEREHRFHPPRKWRLDFAWPEHLVALELDGGTWTQGRHSRGRGYEEDCHKLNQAALDGWLVLRVTAGMVSDGSALRAAEKAFERALEAVA